MLKSSVLLLLILFLDFYSDLLSSLFLFAYSSKSESILLAFLHKSFLPPPIYSLEIFELLGFIYDKLWIYAAKF